MGTGTQWKHERIDPTGLAQKDKIHLGFWSTDQMELNSRLFIFLVFVKTLHRKYDKAYYCSK